MWGREMLITVIYKDGGHGLISTTHLDEFIIAGKITQFLRSDGWAIIGRDPLRAAARRGPRYAKRNHSVSSLDKFLDMCM